MSCTTAPPVEPTEHPVSHAHAAPAGTRLAGIVEARAPASGEQSGFSLLPAGDDAFVALLDLVTASERTLDLQYYIWEKDRSGQLLMSALLDAADRDVRVRVLLDGWVPEWSDEELLALSGHDNLSIRLFNPTLSRRTLVLDLIFHPLRISHRMHNKAFIADNTVAVVGGRNISDRYFAAAPTEDYRDLDVYAAGTIVREISASFDAFWNSTWSVPIASVPRAEKPTVDLTALASHLQEQGHAIARPIPTGGRPRAGYDSVEERVSRLIWTRDARLAVDSPSKPATSSRRLVREARQALVADLRDDLLIESAYFIPRSRGVEALRGLVDGGIRVRVLTNSMGTTDAVTPFAGYRRYRKALLRSGVELYEMRADAQTADGPPGPGSGDNLHSKAAVVDGRHVFIGSFNADPRSVHLNTEIALVIDSPALARDVTAFIEEGMAPENAYELALEDGRVVWREAREGGVATLRHEPDWTPWHGFWSALVSVLPIIDQL